ncbi:MAG: hypothetical protein K0R69_2078 [Clostridia bacterium]|jgi:DNA (cytosine-5)-methyltransferase 1|nr:hypothetical protein [Clostridia bacterium]
MFRVVDLFAGAGGMSLGFLQTGKFKVVAAVENNPNAQHTYLRNHAVEKMQDDINRVDFKKLCHELGRHDKDFEQIDVVIGGPPCQGFSNANRQRNHIISSNNKLVKQYVRAIKEMCPKVFVMENVAMLKSEIYRFYYSEEDKSDLEELNLDMDEDKIEIASNEELACELYAIANCKDIEDVISSLAITEKYYIRLNTLYKKSLNETKLHDYINKNRNFLVKIVSELIEHADNQENHVFAALYKNTLRTIENYLANGGELASFCGALSQYISAQQSLFKLIELFGNRILGSYTIENGRLYYKAQSYKVIDYLRLSLGRDYKIVFDTMNSQYFGVPQQRERFIMIGLNKEFAKKKYGSLENIDVSMPKQILTKEHCKTVYDAISDLEAIPTSYDVNDISVRLENHKEISLPYLRYLRGSNLDTLSNHVITQTRDTALERFSALKQGENFHDLDVSLKHTYSKPGRTQNSIYLRLDYNSPSRTVTNVRKSMWIHPTQDRAVSIREAARLQSFPDNFVFEGPKDAQYQQVGNAVPPLLGRAIGEKVLELLGEMPETPLKDLLLETKNQ